MLLFLARADAESGLPDRREIDLARWAAEHIAAKSDADRARDTSIVVQGEGPWLVRAHSPLLAQLVDNLLDNACKHTEPGTAVRVVVTRQAESIVLAVEDAGPGIDPDDIPHVFEPFYRSAHARRQGRPGVGLGLAIAQRIAVSLGATLTVQSTPGRGCSFHLTLPAADGAAGDNGGAPRYDT